VHEPKKIFVADDDQDILNIIEMMLRSRGYEVVMSSNAEELFACKAEDLPELILMDIWMAGVDGREICGRLKKNKLTSAIPVLFVSANSQIAAITEDCRADGFIAKPFEMKLLLQKVQEHLHASMQAQTCDQISQD